MAGIIAGTFTITTSGSATMMGGNRCRIHRHRARTARLLRAGRGKMATKLAEEAVG